MASFSRFQANQRGGVIERIALMAAAIGLASIGGAQFMQAAVKDGALPRLAFVRSDTDLTRLAQNAPKPGSGGAGPTAGIDYSSTASIRAIGKEIKLDPCTGQPK